jgi:hypothetical protein
VVSAVHPADAAAGDAGTESADSYFVAGTEAAVETNHGSTD